GGRYTADGKPALGAAVCRSRHHVPRHSSLPDENIGPFSNDRRALRRGKRMRVQYVAKDGATRLLVRRAAAEGILDALRCGDSEIGADPALRSLANWPLAVAGLAATIAAAAQPTMRRALMHASGSSR